MYNPNNPFLKALIKNDLNQLRLLFKSSDITSDRNLAICYSAMEKDPKICQLLIKNGADPFANNNEPFINAISKDNINVVKFLYKLGIKKFGNNFIETIITDALGGVVSEASFNGSIKSLKFLIDKGFNIHLSNDAAFRYSCLNEHYECAKLLLSISPMNFHSEKELIFKNACKHNNIKLLNFLYQNREKNSNTVSKNKPIMFLLAYEGFNDACYYGNYDIIKLLIQKKIKVSCLSPINYSIHSYNEKIFNIINNAFNANFKLLIKKMNKEEKDKNTQNILSSIEKNNNIDYLDFKNIAKILNDIGIELDTINKNKYPRISTLIEMIYLKETISINNNKNIKNKHKI